MRRDDHEKSENILLNEIGNVNADFWKITRMAVTAEKDNDALEVIDKSGKAFTSLGERVTEPTGRYVEEEWYEIKRGGLFFRLARTVVLYFCLAVISFFLSFSYQYYLEKNGAGIGKVDIHVSQDEGGWKLSGDFNSLLQN